MLFHSFEFFTLLTLTFIFFYKIPRYRLILLAAANAIFYIASGWKYLILFFAVSTITYYSALQFVKSDRSTYFYIGLLVNVMNLLFFKYFGFIIHNFANVLGINLPYVNTIAAKIVLPVGISFYTFQLIAYLVDVKKGKVEPCTSLLEFWVFISFFGQLIAGPIMRAQDFLPQIKDLDRYSFTVQRFQLAFYYIFMGLIKKLVFADLLADEVNAFFSSAAVLTPAQTWIAAYLFAFQIYFDFSAYSEIARGIGCLFGLDININFRSPYVSTNPSEFWTRWHITLSSWIRDYIYIPLGGSRKGPFLGAVFLMTAMGISGLWHGASWHFVIWGLFWGAMGIVYKQYQSLKKFFKIKQTSSAFYKAISIFVFFHITAIGWVIFRAESVSQARILIRKMFDFAHFSIDRNIFAYLIIVVILYAIHVLEYYLRQREEMIGRLWNTRLHPSFRAAIYAGTILLAILFTRSAPSSFIYFQF